jgi:tetratricopeptide (TPR) repeat protein
MQVCDAVNMALGLMRRNEWDDALVILNDALTAKPDDPSIIFLIGTCHRMTGNDGIAYLLFERAIAIKEDFFDALSNMAQIVRERGDHDLEVSIWAECQRIRPGDPHVLHNLAGCFLNNGTPEKAEEYARESVELEGEGPENMVQLGLALLEQEKFAEGFDALDRALRLGERKHRNFWALGETPFWDGSHGKNVVVYGEQGHGDEIMFASCMDEVFKRCNQVFIDTSKPDMVSLYERSFPDAMVICTPDSQLQPWHEELQIDAMIPFGSLPTLFRREAEQFPEHDGYLKSNAAKRREIRRRLDALGDGPKIGIAWRGGVKKTHSCHRTIPLTEFAPILQQDAHFISLQYTADAAAEAEMQQDVTGVPVHHWQAAIDDFDMLTAMIDELDLVISVPQTAVHQRAGLGKECWVLTPAKAPWTFGLARDNVIWYPKQTKQFRQELGEDWAPAIKRVAEALSERFTGSEVKESGVGANPEKEIELRSV